MPQRDTPQSAVQSHYNKQANLNKNQMQVMKQRKNGPLIKYKDFANSVKRRMYAEYAQGVSSLVDLACGRGGDISKWRDAGAQNVIAMDLSAAQLEDARNREEGDGKGDAKGDGKGDVKGVSRGGAGAGKSTKIVWIQDSLLNAQLGAKLRPKLPDPTAGADAVAIMFAVQFAFDSREHADALLRTISQLLRPGGVFFGTAPDGDAIRAQLGASNELRLAPPEHPPPPPCRVGVYFGSFDPIHENHVAVAQHAQHAHGMRFVYLVSNADNPRKPFVSALSARAELIDVRLAQPDL